MNFERNKLIGFNSIIILCFIIQTFDTFILENNYKLNRIRRQPECGFICSSGECIDEDKECDGVADCKDTSDETEACNRIRCKSSKCKSGECINESYICDGIEQCKDGSDETIFACKERKCPEFTYQCTYGACVNGNARCNGVNDCVDKSDEAACNGIVTTSTPTQLPVTNKPIQLPGNCMLPQRPRNGDWIVKGASNQFEPGDFVTPTTILEMRCKNRYVLKGAQFLLCLGGKWSQDLPECLQCKNGSDETIFACKERKCSEFAYQCTYRTCVNGNARCNSVNDCVDKSDEAGCNGIVTTSTPTQPPLTNKPIQPQVNCMLPQRPTNGDWIVKGASNQFEPGDFVTSTTILEMRCKNRYVLKGAQFLLCLGGKWSQDLPECLRI